MKQKKNFNSIDIGHYCNSDDFYLQRYGHFVGTIICCRRVVVLEGEEQLKRRLSMAVSATRDVDDIYPPEIP